MPLALLLDLTGKNFPELTSLTYPKAVSALHGEQNPVKKKFLFGSVTVYAGY